MCDISHWSPITAKVLQWCMNPPLKTNSKVTYHVYTTSEHCVFAYALTSPERLCCPVSPPSLYTLWEVIFPSEKYQEIHQPLLLSRFSARLRFPFAGWNKSIMFWHQNHYKSLICFHKYGEYHLSPPESKNETQIPQNLFNESNNNAFCSPIGRWWRKIPISINITEAYTLKMERTYQIN